MNIERPVAELLKEDPRTLGVFEKYRIDFCCGGGSSLKEACRRAGAPVDEVIQALSAVESAAIESPPALPTDLAELIQFVEDTHHVYTRDALARIHPLMEKVVRVHGDRHPELNHLSELCDALADDLEPHLLKEERVLFPYLRALSSARRRSEPIPRAPFGTVRNPIGMMHVEHERVGELLHLIEETTRGPSAAAPFTPPDDACGSYRALFIALSDLVKDVRRHVFIENEVMFPLAARLEAQPA